MGVSKSHGKTMRCAALTFLLVAAALVVSACSPTVRSGAGGRPPLAVQDDWARQRVEAILALYTFTPEAAAAIRGLDVRHIAGRPGWFGSTGYRGFVGLGQSRPSSIVHEVSHSLYGPLPVVGRPGLSYEPGPDGRLSAGLQAQRRDLERFIEQPPDAFEPLRARLRQIPDLVSGSGYPGLYHLGEAEIIFFTGGNLDLAPPILRKYYGPMLASGPFKSWDETIRWYLSLPGGQRRIADQYAGFGHMPAEGYRVPPDPQAKVAPRIAAIVLQEERQRLTDFVEQFGLYFKALDQNGPVIKDIRFWRGYVRDMVHVYRQHRDLPASLGQRGRRIGAALQFLADLDDTERSQRPAKAKQGLRSDAFLFYFVPALDNGTLLALTRDEDQRSGAPERLPSQVRGALEPFHMRMLDLASDLRQTLQSNRSQAGAIFDGFLRGLSERERRSMNLIIEVLAEADRDLARAAMLGLSPEMARVMVKEGPAFTRFLLQPEEVVSLLGFRDPLSPVQLAGLAKLFNENVSATPRIDNPFLRAVYTRLAALGQSDPQRAIRLFAETGLLVEPFLTEMPGEASALFSRDLALTAEALTKANPVRLPPPRAIYRMAQQDAETAARLTLAYEDRGAADIVSDALAFFGYDLVRSQQEPGLRIAVEAGARYLDALARLRGDAWLEQALARMARRYGESIAAGETDPAFLRVYRQTLEASLALLPDAETRQRLGGIAGRALGQ